MNFEQILSAYKSKACILSVETYPGGGYGNLHLWNPFGLKGVLVFSHDRW